MKTLNEVLAHTRSSSLQAEVQPLTPLPGSTTSDGPSIIPPPSPSEQSRGPVVPVQTHPHPDQDGKSKPTGFARSDSVSRTPEEEDLLLAAISKLCALQKHYGKNAGELETLLDGFLWLLDDLATEDILRAMKIYANRHNDIPTPADIRNIIDPPKQPLSAALYVDLKKRLREGNVFVSDEERRFCRAFEEQELAKAGGGELERAKREIEQHARLAFNGGGND